MRPPNQAARDQLVSVLGRMPRASAPEIAAALSISIRSLHRLLAELPPEHWVCAGQSRRTRYARTRALRGSHAAVPLHAVDETGQAREFSSLSLLHPQGALMPMQESLWPVPPESRDGWWEGLPYPLYDSRPQGFLGRQFARAEHQRLGVSPTPGDWNDDDIVHVLRQSGVDVSGNLLLGEPAFRRWLAIKMSPPEPVPEKRLGDHYLECAQQALRDGVPGSSVAGEFPKFTALRLQCHATPHVLVKFAGAGGSAAERRWADLLVCEHLALDCAASLEDVTCARTRVIQHGDRTFLESERFDRFGLHGRGALCTLDALNNAFLGAATTDWTSPVSQLHALDLVEARTVAAVERLQWFGRLTGNTDMHLGNLSFHVEQRLRLAPAYDMLPMMYAPLAGGEVPPREYTPPLPLPAQREVWNVACASALAFWRRASNDARISAAFQAICAGNHRALTETAEKL